jgi:hypothetical protein
MSEEKSYTCFSMVYAVNVDSCDKNGSLFVERFPWRSIKMHGIEINETVKLKPVRKKVFNIFHGYPNNILNVYFEPLVMKIVV